MARGNVAVKTADDVVRGSDDGWGLLLNNVCTSHVRDTSVPCMVRWGPPVFHSRSVIVTASARVYYSYHRAARRPAADLSVVSGVTYARCLPKMPAPPRPPVRRPAGSAIDRVRRPSSEVKIAGCDCTGHRHRNALLMTD